MIDFGIKISPSSRIDLDRKESESWRLLIEKEPDIQKCMACGSCCGSCSGGNFTDVSLRSAILAIQNGNKRKAVDLLKGCMLCGKCTMICPRGINTRHLILSINKVLANENRTDSK